MPGWWNGRHRGLKIPCPQGRAGSTPALGTKFENYARDLKMRAYTVDELMSLAEPCDSWAREHVQALYDKAGITTATVLDILMCPKLSDKDAVHQAMRMVPYCSVRVVIEVLVEQAICSVMLDCKNDEWLMWAQAWIDGSNKDRPVAAAAAEKAAFTAEAAGEALATEAAFAAEMAEDAAHIEDTKLTTEVVSYATEIIYDVVNIMATIVKKTQSIVATWTIWSDARWMLVAVLAEEFLANTSEEK